MICPNCQHNNRQAANVCSNCGVKLAAGSMLGKQTILATRYQIIKSVGKGGMGAVYLAEDANAFGRQRIVKEMLLPTDSTAQREAENNFRREAELLSKLRHPRIPEIQEYFVQGGKSYLVMEFVEGENLEQRLGRLGSPLPEREVVDYAKQICEILEYLANCQPPVIHRDIKPANIVVDETGHAHLVDFGIARAKPSSGIAARRDTSLYGTQGYAPPEQHAGQTEPRSDIYALGATMHHLLTGRDPRDPGQTSFDPLARIAPNVSPGLYELVEQMLNPDVSNRPNATEVKTKLGAIQSIKPLSFSPVAAAFSIRDLVELCSSHRLRAIQYLRNQDIEKWLREIGHPDLAAEAKQIRIDINRHKRTADPNAALDQLLGILDPSWTPPQFTITPEFLNLKVLQKSSQTININLTSDGRYLSGTIEAQPDYYFSMPPYFECAAPNFGADIAMNFRPYGSGVGAHRAVVFFKTHHLQREFDINYQIVTAPVLRSSLHYVRTRVTANMEPISIELANTGGDVLEGEIISNSSWMSPTSVTTFAIPPGQSIQAGILVDPSQLSNYPNVGMLQIHSNGGVSEVTIEVLPPRRFPIRLFGTLVAFAPLLAAVGVLGSLIVGLDAAPIMIFGCMGFLGGLTAAITIALIVYLTT